MKFLSVLTILGLTCLALTTCDKTDIGLTTVQIIENHGYVSETHYVTTDDGYILTLYRIPHGINDDGGAKKPAVLVMHGLTGSSADYVNRGPGIGLGYFLADSGYDVWLANARGTTYSRNHTSLDPDADSEKFYDFSFHEIGFYDVANIIDHILTVNGDDSLYYIGHSQGTTAFLVLASTRPEYNDKIKVASLMAPAAILPHAINTFVQDWCKNIDELEQLFKSWGVYEIPYAKEIREYGSTVCADTSSDPICDTLFQVLLAGDGGEVDEEYLPIMFTNFPSNSAIKGFIHYGQLVRDGVFHFFDYGENNLEIYGTETAPGYDLAKISTPVAFYYGKNDGLVTVEDAQTLISMVPNVANDYLVPYDLFVHNDFIYAKDVIELVYNELLSVMAKY